MNVFDSVLHSLNALQTEDVSPVVSHLHHVFLFLVKYLLSTWNYHKHLSLFRILF